MATFDTIKQEMLDKINIRLRENWGMISGQKPANPDEYFKKASLALFEGKPLVLPDDRTQIDFNKLPQTLKSLGMDQLAGAAANTLYVPKEDDAREIAAAIDRGQEKSSGNWLQKIMDYVIGFITGIGRALAGGGWGAVMGSIAERRAASAIPYIDEELNELAKKRPQLAPLLNDPKARQGIHQGIHAFAQEAVGNKLPGAEGVRPENVPVSEEAPVDEKKMEKMIRDALHQGFVMKDAKGKNSYDDLKENVTTKSGEMTQLEFQHFEKACADKLIQVIKGQHGGKRLSACSPQEAQELLKKEMSAIVNHVAVDQNWSNFATRNSLGIVTQKDIVEGVMTKMMPALNDKLNMLKLADVASRSGGRLDKLTGVVEPTPAETARTSAMNPDHRAPTPPGYVPTTSLPPPAVVSPAVTPSGR